MSRGSRPRIQTQPPPPPPNIPFGGIGNRRCCAVQPQDQQYEATDMNTVRRRSWPPNIDIWPSTVPQNVPNWPYQAPCDRPMTMNQEASDNGHASTQGAATMHKY